jgi:hypothetical protein
MTDGQQWFEPATLLDRCSLSEALLWVWCGRLPSVGQRGLTSPDNKALTYLHDWECEILTIPAVPEGAWASAHLYTRENIKTLYDYLPATSEKAISVARCLSRAKEVKQWLSLLEAKLDVPAAKVFLVLADGQLDATGKLLPVGVQVVDFITMNETGFLNGGCVFDDLNPEQIPKRAWTRNGIDWLSNSVTIDARHFCEVSIEVESLLRLFPGERTPVSKAEFVGNFLVADIHGDAAEIDLRKKRGRPTVYAWEEFFIEVAAVVKESGLPEKKESLIAHMMEWFEKTKGQSPSRSAVSDRLTLYYHRLGRAT